MSENKISVYVEFGPNISKVLASMVDKVYTCQGSGNYYYNAFSKISEAIVNSVKESVRIQCKKIKF